MKSLFIAYNDEHDSARANHIRKQLLATNEYRIEGYSPFTTWLKSKGGELLGDLREQYDRQLADSSAVLVLLGNDSAANPWIRYAIERSHVNAKPLMVIDISQVPDEYGETTTVDINPLERFAVMEQNEKVYLSDRYEYYVWDEYSIDDIDSWLASASAGAELLQRNRDEENREARSLKMQQFAAQAKPATNISSQDTGSHAVAI